MILGVGCDLVDIRRIEKTLGRWGEKFIERCFTETEKERSEGRRGRVESYAKRYAAKEACAKALGTGFRRGVWHKDMGVINLPGGRPTMALTGGAARRLAELVPPGMTARIDVSITDEPPLAQVIVIISAVPNSPS